MFYSNFLLAKRGPLGKLWLAAHGWGKNLSKQVIGQTNIKQAAESLRKPQTPLSLRVSGHLLLGLSRIYQKQVSYLYNDSNDAVLKIKAASRPGGAASALELEEGAEAANIDLNVIPSHMLEMPNLDNLQSFSAVLPDDDWVAIPNKSTYVGRKGGRGVSLDDGGSMTREMVEEDSFYPHSAARSSVSDIEVARRSGGEEDERSSVFSDRDDSVRMRNRGDAAGVRKSLLQVTEMQSRRNRENGIALELDEDEQALARMIGVGADGDYSDNNNYNSSYNNNGGHADFNGDFNADYFGGDDFQADHGMALEGKDALDDEADRLVTEDDVLAAARAVIPKAKETKDHERKARAAKRKEKKGQQQQQVIDENTILAGDKIKAWLNDASETLRPSRRNQFSEAYSEGRPNPLVGFYQQNALKRLSMYQAALTKEPTKKLPAEIAFDALLSRAPMTGPDGDALIMPSLPDIETEFIAPLTIGGAALHPSLQAILVTHGTGKTGYRQVASLAKEDTLRASVVEAEHTGVDHGHADFNDYLYDADDFGRSAVDHNIVAAEAVDDEGVLQGRSSMDDRSRESTAPNSVGKLSAMSFQSRPSADAVDEDAASVVSRSSGVTPGGVGSDTTSFNADVNSAYVEKGKWHAQTVAMLQVLAGEMTGPELPGGTNSGRKRKAKEMSDTSPSASATKYDLANVTVGKGSSSDPVSFFELARNESRHAAAVSFFQLLVLRSWDIIDVKQDGAYGDLQIVRTKRFAQALSDMEGITA